MNDLKDKVVLITGAGQGFGVAMLPTLAAQGAIIAANDLTTINLDSPIAQIVEEGGQAKAYDTDVCKKLALQTMLGDVLEDFSRIDILINHASVQPRMPILEMDEWDWRRTLDVNLTATFLATQSVGRIMREQGGGVILNVGPVENEEGLDKRSAYLSSKAGIESFTKVAASELKEHHVIVNAILPQKSNLEESVQAAIELILSDQTGQVIKIERKNNSAV